MLKRLRIGSDVGIAFISCIKSGSHIDSKINISHVPLKLLNRAD